MEITSAASEGLLAREVISQADRIVVKVGSSSLTREDGQLNTEFLAFLVEQIAEHKNQGQQVVLVTSGAIAAGIAPLGLKGRPHDLETAQAAASVGQGVLIAEYSAQFAKYGLTVGQILLTVTDTVRRSHYRNAQRALERLLDLGIVPIINENDTVATTEIRFGDNDRLAALVSHLVRADALLLLTDVDGLHDAPPSNPTANRIPYVKSLKEVADVEVTSRGSSLGTGGMVTKLDSVRIATESGVPVVLTKATNLAKALVGEDVGTFFAVTGKRMTRRRLWLGYAAKTRGKLVLDAGAVKAVTERGASLLPAGVIDFRGDFVEGDPVELVSGGGLVIARGIVSYASEELPNILGKSTTELLDEYGAGYDRVLVHRDQLVQLEK